MNTIIIASTLALFATIVGVYFLYRDGRHRHMMAEWVILPHFYYQSICGEVTNILFQILFVLWMSGIPEGIQTLWKSSEKPN